LSSKSNHDGKWFPNTCKIVIKFPFFSISFPFLLFSLNFSLLLHHSLSWKFLRHSQSLCCYYSVFLWLLWKLFYVIIILCCCYVTYSWSFPSILYSCSCSKTLFKILGLLLQCFSWFLLLIIFLQIQIKVHNMQL
jgi:hypothetical protein